MFWAWFLRQRRRTPQVYEVGAESCRSSFVSTLAGRLQLTLYVECTAYTGVMATPLLATKLYVPPHRPNVVLRPRLIERLNDGLYRKLTLVSAPAGFGKTTLLSEWLATCARPARMAFAGCRGSEPTRFLSYLVAALHTIMPTLGAGGVGCAPIWAATSSRSNSDHPAQ